MPTKRRASTGETAFCQFRRRRERVAYLNLCSWRPQWSPASRSRRWPRTPSTTKACSSWTETSRTTQVSWDRTGPASSRLSCQTISRPFRLPSSLTASTASTTRSTSAGARRTTTTSPTGAGRAAASPRRATSSTPSPRRTSTEICSSTSAPTVTTRQAAPPTSVSGSYRTAARCRAATAVPTPIRRRIPSPASTRTATCSSSPSSTAVVATPRSASTNGRAAG